MWRPLTVYGGDILLSKQQKAGQQLLLCVKPASRGLEVILCGAALTVLSASHSLISSKGNNRRDKNTHLVATVYSFPLASSLMRDSPRAGVSFSSDKSLGSGSEVIKGFPAG